jgi:Uncharacterized protein conserved in bacteria
MEMERGLKDSWRILKRLILHIERDSDMGIAAKFWKFFFVEEEWDNTPVLPENEARSGLNAASMDEYIGQKVVVCKTEKIDEAPALVDLLKSHRQVVVNFENSTVPGVPQKIIDYVSGAVYALDGSCQQVGQNIFLFTLASAEFIKGKRSFFNENEIGPWGTYRR